MTSPVSMQQLIDAGVDCGTIASIATSTAETVVDRLGQTKLTMVGACNKIGFEQATTYSTSGQTLLRPTQTVYYSGLVYAPAYGTVYPFVTSGAFNVTLWRVIDTDAQKVLDNTQVYNVAALRLFPAFTNNQHIYLEGHTTQADGGQGVFYWSASSAAPDNDGTVIKVASVTTGRWVRNCTLNDLHADWFGPNVVLDDVVNLLPSTGGTVNISSKRYKPSGYYYGVSDLGKFLSKDNVKIKGTKIPSFSNDCKTLENGSIIEGQMIVYANNVILEDLGIDSGFTVCNTYYSGTPQEGLVLTYPNNTSKGASTLKKNASLHNVRTLCKGALSPVHALILGEGYTNISATGIIEGCYGIHGVVVKCSNVNADSLIAYCNTNGMIIKSDAQSTSISNRIAISKVKVFAGGPLGTAPYEVSTSGVGCYFHAALNNIDIVQIGSIYSEGHPRGIALLYDQAGKIISNVQIDSITTEANSVVGCDFYVPTANFAQSIQIDKIVNRNSPAGSSIASPEGSDISIGEIKTVACNLGAYIQGSGVLIVNGISSKTNTDGAVRILHGCKPSIGTIVNSGTGPTYDQTGGGVTPSLAAGVTQSVGNRKFSCDLKGFGISLGGLVVPNPATNLICNLPYWARPQFTIRLVATGTSAGNVQSAIPVTISDNGDVLVNEIGGGSVNCAQWLSLDGISFNY